MKRKIAAIFLLLAVISSSGFGYTLYYAEQLYKLYHVHFYQYPERIAENIHYLEAALRADFVNPLNALARIENEKQWERYRYLFYTHVNLKLTELYLRWGSKYDRQRAYFYNAPWQRENLDSLDKAEKLYRYALVYWEDAVEWSEKAETIPIFLEEIQNWSDESYRIMSGDLDYADIIDEQLARLQEIKEYFQNMDENTY